MMKLKFIVFFISVVGFVESSLKPRGVPQQKLSLYRPDQPFTCFDKSKSYSFEHVNDDYCDCPDGSDEPGTSACPNGRFYCPNVGYRPKYISSMFVDDGVCDCCDGSDEQLRPGGESPCPNRCEALGRIARQAAEQKRATMEMGHELYKTYITKYQSEIGEKRERLKKLEEERTAADEEKQKMQTAKEEIEKLETEAKDKHHAEWEETKKQLQEQKQLKLAEEAFADLDVNKDSRVAIDEMQTHLEFDVDGDGLVSEDEARENLEDPGEGGADWAHFTEKVWPHIKEIYQKTGTATSTTEAPVTEEPTIPPYPDEEEDEEDEDERLAEERMKEFQRPPHDYHHDIPKKKEEEEFKMPEYPEETKKLIEAADQARTAYETARGSYDELDREYSDLLSVTSTDFGPQGEFYALRGECFEVDDREYTYKLCPFDRSGQKQRHGHHETNLGRFEAWRPEGANKYSVQMYTQGETCWNGPARSVMAKISCGGENQILSVTEPARCEYNMEFATPAACSVPPPPLEHHSFWGDPADHGEL